MDYLKALVEALVILNDDNLAQTAIDNNDVQWCLSKLQDMLAADMEPVVRCKGCYQSVAIGDVLHCTYWSKNTDENGYCHEGG